MNWTLCLTGCAMIATILAGPVEPTPARPGPEREPGRHSDSLMVAVVPPATLLAGRVLQKDGVTPVAGAEVRMTWAVDGETRAARSNREGRFRMKLSAGQYGLQITRRMEIYKARAVYRVPAGGRVDIDFLLLPDFEKGKADPADPPSIAGGPDPVPADPALVGSVVDMVRSRNTRRLGRWTEALGFLASLLAVGLAGN